jgi:hypothetical protein
MNIVLINLILWPIVILGVLPLLVHLFARSKPPRYNFSSIEFILKIVRTTMRVKRPQDWLLLLIRTILFLSLIFMFLRPLLFSQRRLAGYTQKKNIVLIVDATASMAYVDGSQTRFAAACAEASEILSGLSARDFVNVVWLDSSPDAVFPELGSNISYLKNALRRAKVTNESGDIGEAIRIAVDLIGNNEGTHEICIVSDFQKSTWASADIAVPDAIDLIRVKVGDVDSANSAVSAIICDPAAPLVGEESTVYCEVYNYSPQPRRQTVFLQLEERRVSQDLLIPAWGKAVAIFTHTFRTPGTVAVNATLSDDTFVGDDQRTELVDVREFLSVAIMPGDTAEGIVWQRVLGAVGWARTTVVNPADLADNGQYDVIMISEWRGEHVARIREHLADGCIVICSPARDIKIASISKLAGISGDATSAESLNWQEFDKASGIKIAAPSDAVFKLFADGEHGDPAHAMFKGRLNFPERAIPGGDLLITYDDGVVGVMRFGGLFLWNLPLDARYSDWPSQVEFLPVLAEMILASRTERVASVSRIVFPGEHVSWYAEGDVLGSDVVLKAPSDEVLPVEIRPSAGGVTFDSGEVDALGLYTWQYKEKVTGYGVVNFPDIESDLRSMTIEEVRTGDGVVVSGGSRVRRLRDGVKLWPYLLLTALCMVVFEGAVLLWVERK